MKAKKIVIGALITVVALPVLTVAAALAYMAALNRTNGGFVSSGQKREYLLYVPKSYDPKKPAPLVISLHGAATWPAQQMNASRWSLLADRDGFIVVYPAGTLEGPRIWHVERSPGLTRDVKFIGELIDTLEAHYTIDRTRIYANGLSNGGGMSFVLSCTLSDRIAAVGMVAAAQTLPLDWCPDHHPVPMIEFHGTADPIVPYAGGLSASAFAPTKFDPNAKPFPSVQGFAANWARRNGCAPSPADSIVNPNVTRREFTHCADSASVVLYSVRGAGHQWFGGKPMPQWMVGPSSDAVDATNVMWAFFQAHPLTHR